MNDSIRALRGAAAAALLVCLCAPAGATDITLKNAWMRPARAGPAPAYVYVDITTDVALKLVGASSPLAKSVAIVLVDNKPDGTSAEATVKDFELPGGKETRFAYNGNRLEMRDVFENLAPGASVPLKLEFVEVKGNARNTIEIEVLVRGVILPPPPEPDAKPN
ncbi:MAG: copper chaperone PCu(A)C [Casimicrobiaceae bacterium]